MYAVTWSCDKLCETFFFPDLQYMLNYIKDTIPQTQFPSLSTTYPMLIDGQPYASLV
jgi:hypothetical protein